MIALPAGIRVWLVCGRTDMRKGIDGLAMLAQQQMLNENPLDGALFAFRGRRGGMVKLLWYNGQMSSGLTRPSATLPSDVQQASGTGPLRPASDRDRPGVADAGATVDVA